jgi:choline kinase
MKKKKLLNNDHKYKAVILAAGVGSRINEITKKIPKTMIKINKKYIFEHILENLHMSNIHEVIIVVGYKANILKPLLKKKCNELGINLKIVFNKRYKSTNTMYSLWLARKYLKSKFIFLHGDLIFSYKMLFKFIRFPAHNAVLVDKNNPKDWDDAMKIISNNKLLKYMSKSITVSEMDGVAIGMYKFNYDGSKLLFKTISQLVKLKIEKNWVSEAINIISKKIKINLQISKLHAWADVDNLFDLKSANKIIKDMDLE